MDTTKINPLVRLVKMKRSGAHGKTTKAKRTQEKVKFKKEVLGTGRERAGLQNQGLGEIRE